MLVKDFIGAYQGKLDCIVVEVGSKEPLFTTRNKDFLISFIGEHLLVNWDFEIMAVNPALVYFHLLVEKVETDEEFEKRNQEFLESLNEIPEPSKYDNHDIRNLKLPARVMNRLTEFGIESVGELRNFSRKDLLEVKGLAKRGVDIIEHRLYQLGLSLKAD